VDVLHQREHRSFLSFYRLRPLLPTRLDIPPRRFDAPETALSGQRDHISRDSEQRSDYNRLALFNQSVKYMAAVQCQSPTRAG